MICARPRSCVLPAKQEPPRGRRSERCVAKRRPARAKFTSGSSISPCSTTTPLRGAPWLAWIRRQVPVRADRAGPVAFAIASGARVTRPPRPPRRRASLRSFLSRNWSHPRQTYGERAARTQLAEPSVEVDGSRVHHGEVDHQPQHREKRPGICTGVTQRAAATRRSRRRPSARASTCDALQSASAQSRTKKILRRDRAVYICIHTDTCHSSPSL